jgi:hypothetical protein
MDEDSKIAADGPSQCSPILIRSVYPRQTVRKDGTQSYGPSRQRGVDRRVGVALCQGQTSGEPWDAKLRASRRPVRIVQVVEPPQRLMVAEPLDALEQDH